MSITKQTQPQKGTVLLKALLNTSGEIGLNLSDLSDALGVELAGLNQNKRNY